MLFSLEKRVQRYKKFLYPQHMISKKFVLVLNGYFSDHVGLVPSHFHEIDT